MDRDRFEYKRIPVNNITDEILDELGDAGWEFVEQDNEGKYIFKRKKDLTEGRQILHD